MNAPSNELEQGLSAYKQRYRRELTALLSLLEPEIEAIDNNPGFEPSPGIKAIFQEAIAIGERLSALNEIVADLLPTLQMEQKPKLAEPDKTNSETTELPAAEGYRNISAWSIDQIQEYIRQWTNQLKPGDRVFVMYAGVAGWQHNDRGYNATVEKVSEKRIVLDDTNSYHRLTGYSVVGVNAVGLYSLIPEDLSPQILGEAWMAMESVRRYETLKSAPIQNIVKALSLLEQTQ